MEEMPTELSGAPAARTFSIGGSLTVSRLGFGAMRLAEGTGPSSESLIWSGPDDPENAQAVLRRAVELGVDLIDTADSYGVGANEKLIASALFPYRAGTVLSTKTGIVRPSPHEWIPLGRPEYLKQQAELSLRRLRKDHLDLLFLHRIDPHVPLAEQIGALGELREEGKVRHIGLSEVTIEELGEAARSAPIAAVQSRYNVADRDNESVVEYCAARGIAFLAYFPLAIGTHAGSTGPLAEIAYETGATPGQVALAWLLHRSPNILPIPGTRSLAHLEENQGAADVRLTPDQIARLAKAV
ncbi:oxidoreductase [Streptomyces sp. SID1328]|uniref:aldo/keto reductase n=1 Tax=Streptomyces sp. SID1328 TaxID=2690250 RepID=UPI0013687DAA|nr:aldo/keto reductase [Streptomyces sp. SID1328]MYV40963.1 oxidoreductase [Streptomyces sp. SID1328]